MGGLAADLRTVSAGNVHWKVCDAGSKLCHAWADELRTYNVSCANGNDTAQHHELHATCRSAASQLSTVPRNGHRKLRWTTCHGHDWYGHDAANGSHRGCGTCRHYNAGPTNACSRDHDRCSSGEGQEEQKVGDEKDPQGLLLRCGTCRHYNAGPTNAC